MATLLDSYSESNEDSDYFIDENTTEAGQTFSNVNRMTLDSCKFYLNNFNNPTGNVRAKIYAITGTYGSTSKATGSPLAISDNVAVTSLSSTYSLITFTFSSTNRIVLSASTYYALMVENTGYTIGNPLNLGRDISSPTAAGNSCDLFAGNFRSGSGADTCFYVYGVTAPALATGSFFAFF